MNLPSVRRDLLATYSASAARVAAWVVVAGVVYRHFGPDAFAVVVLVRATLGLLAYASFGLGPALTVQIMAIEHQARRRPNDPAAAAASEAGAGVEPGVIQLDYASAPRLTRRQTVPAGADGASLMAHAGVLVWGSWIVGGLLLWAYTANLGRLHDIPSSVGTSQAAYLAFWFGVGVLLRIAGDAAGGALQARGGLAWDQKTIAAGEVVWALLTLTVLLPWKPPLEWIGLSFATANLFTFLSRKGLAARWGLPLRLDLRKRTDRTAYLLDRRLLRVLLVAGLAITLGQVADFLYAPVDYLILNRLIDPLAVATYAPAVQVDAALLLVAGGLATTLFPRAVRMFTAGDRDRLWRIYLRTTLAAGGLTAVASVAAWGASPWVFRGWLGDDLPDTRAILPLVLVHTTLGAAAGVGRVVLLAAGKAGAYATSVLVGGMLNVGLSLAFVAAGWGLEGVIGGTVLSVGLRCVVWTPWYVRRTLRVRNDPRP